MMALKVTSRILRLIFDSEPVTTVMRVMDGVLVMMRAAKFCTS